jgi:hypothetical protein
MISCAKSWLSENDVWLLGHPNKSATPGWVRQKMEFKTSLRMFLTKPGSIGFSVGHVTRVEQLDEIPAAFWSGLNYRRDIHIRYTRELIAWRFCEAPHRKYSVSMVSRNGEFYGLRITRQLKGPVHLLIDAVASLDNLSAVLSCGVLPVLHLHSGEGLSGVEVERACWRLPINRRFPFFLSKWSGHNDIDASGISLSASDF